jgi:hypothetical protein
MREHPFSHQHNRGKDDSFLIGIVWGVESNWVHSALRPLIGLLCQPLGDYDHGEIGGIIIGRGNRSTRRKPAPVPLCPPQKPHDLTWARTVAAAVVSQRLIA